MSVDTERDATLGDYTDQPDEDGTDDDHTCHWCGETFDRWLDMARHEHGTDDAPACAAKPDDPHAGASKEVGL